MGTSQLSYTNALKRGEARSKKRNLFSFLIIDI
jgi:hypothetical protein